MTTTTAPAPALRAYRIVFQGHIWEHEHYYAATSLDDALAQHHTARPTAGQIISAGDATESSAISISAVMYALKRAGIPWAEQTIVAALLRQYAGTEE